VLTSTDIQNIIASQTSMFGMVSGNSNQLSQNIGSKQGQSQAQYSYAPTTDPRTADSQSRFAYGTASAVVDTARAVPAGMMVADMFGMLPNVLDPFSGTLDAAKLGYRTAGGGMNGIMRGMGFGATALGGYMAAGAAFNTITSSVLQGAQEGLAINQMLSNHITRGTLPGMSLGNAGRFAVADTIRGMASSDPWTNTSELTNLMGGLLDQGAFRSTTNTTQFISKFRELKDQVQQVATMFSTTLNEALPIINQFNGMGFYGVAGGSSAAIYASGSASAFGLNPASIAGAGSGGAAMFRSMGLHGALGAAQSMRLATQIGGIQDRDFIREMAGGADYDTALSSVASGLVGSAAQVGMSGLGTQALYALVDPETGRIDQGRAALLASGGMSKTELNRLVQRGMQSNRVKSAIGSRRDSLVGSLIEQIGPEGMLTGFANAQMLTRGLRAGEDGNDVVSSLIQQFTGLGEDQAQLIQQLASQGPAIKSLIKDRIQDELRSSKNALDSQQATSLEGIKRRLVNKFVEPLLAPVRQWGSSLAQMGADAFDNISEWLFGAPSNGAIQYTGMSGLMVQGRMGMSPVGKSLYDQGMGYNPGKGAGLGSHSGFSGGGRYYAMGTPEGGDTGAYGAALRFMGLAGDEDPNTTIANSIQGITYGSGAYFGGRMLGGVASSLAEAAGLVNPFAGGIGATFNRGLGAFARRSVGSLARLAGSTALKAVPILGEAYMAYDAAFNLMPAVSKELGFTPDYSGALTEEQSDAVRRLTAAGADVGMMNVSGSDYLMNSGHYQMLREKPAEYGAFHEYGRGIGRFFSGVANLYTGNRSVGYEMVNTDTMSNAMANVYRGLMNPTGYLGVDQDQASAIRRMAQTGSNANALYRASLGEGGAMRAYRLLRSQEGGEGLLSKYSATDPGAAAAVMSLIDPKNAAESFRALLGDGVATTPDEARREAKKAAMGLSAYVGKGAAEEFHNTISNAISGGNVELVNRLMAYGLNREGSQENLTEYLRKNPNSMPASVQNLMLNPYVPGSWGDVYGDVRNAVKGTVGYDLRAEGLTADSQLESLKSNIMGTSRALSGNSMSRLRYGSGRINKITGMLESIAESASPGNLGAGENIEKLVKYVMDNYSPEEGMALAQELGTSGIGVSRAISLDRIGKRGGAQGALATLGALGGQMPRWLVEDIRHSHDKLHEAARSAVGQVIDKATGGSNLSKKDRDDLINKFEKSQFGKTKSERNAARKELSEKLGAYGVADAVKSAGGAASQQEKVMQDFTAALQEFTKVQKEKGK
jgi:hypothetical protein